MGWGYDSSPVLQLLRMVGFGKGDESDKARQYFGVLVLRLQAMVAYCRR